MRPFKVSLPFGWPGESGADTRSFTIARSYPGYGRAPPETKDGHPSSQAYSPAIRLNAEIRRHQHTIPDNALGVSGMTQRRLNRRGLLTTFKTRALFAQLLDIAVIVKGLRVGERLLVLDLAAMNDVTHRDLGDLA